MTLRAARRCLAGKVADDRDELLGGGSGKVEQEPDDETHAPGRRVD